MRRHGFLLGAMLTTLAWSAGCGAHRTSSASQPVDVKAPVIRVRSLIPEFEAWQRSAREQTPKDRAASFRRDYLLVHRDVFGPVFPVPSDRALNDYLEWLRPRADSALVLSRTIAAAVPEAVRRLTLLFPSLAGDTVDIVIGVGFMSNGTVRNANGRATLFLGPDVHTIVDASLADPVILIAHELTHVVHARRNPAVYGLVEAALRREPSPLYISVFAEGLATWASGQVAPGSTLAARLLSTDLAQTAPAAAPRLWPVLHRELTSTDVPRYGQWFFLGGQTGEIPPRFAYWAGDAIVARMAAKRSPEAMLKRTPDELLTDVREIVQSFMGR